MARRDMHAKLLDRARRRAFQDVKDAHSDEWDALFADCSVLVRERDPWASERDLYLRARNTTMQRLSANHYPEYLARYAGHRTGLTVPLDEATLRS